MTDVQPNAGVSTGTSSVNAGATNTTAAAPTDWRTGMDPEIQGWLDNKKFGSPKDVAKSYFELERLFGADKAGRTVMVPKDWENPAETEPFFNRLGRPESPDKYDLKLPQEHDPEFVKWARETMHKVGLPVNQANKLVQAFSEKERQILDSRTEEAKIRHGQEWEGLKKEWGAAFEARKVLVDRAGSRFGLNESELQSMTRALGPGKLMKFLADVGEKMGEGDFVSGEGSDPTVFTPQQAAAKVQEKMSDPDFKKAYLDGERWAVDQIIALQKMRV